MSLFLGKLPAWRFEAACSPDIAESFYPTKGSHSPVTKAMCRSCPVQQECDAYAIEHGEKYGIWGGEAERRAERRAARLNEEMTA